MGLINRLKNIFVTQANQTLNSWEDPKATLDQSMERLQGHLIRVNRSLVEVTAAKRRLEAQRNALKQAATRYEQQARLAIKKQREDLAAQALERKQTLMFQLSDLDTNIANLEQQIETLKATQSALRTKIELFRYKKEELKAVYDSAQAQVKVREALSGVSDDLADVGQTIRRAEERIQQMQARAQAIDELIDSGVLDDVLSAGISGPDDIDKELARITRDEAVEAELARLKQEAAAA